MIRYRAHRERKLWNQAELQLICINERQINPACNTVGDLYIDKTGAESMRDMVM